MTGIFDVIGGLASGGAAGIEEGLKIKSTQDENRRREDVNRRAEDAAARQARRQKVQDAMAQELHKARIGDYATRARQAQEAEAERAQAESDRELLAAEYLHRYRGGPDGTGLNLQEQYGSDFRPGGRARANIDAIIQAGDEQDELERRERQLKDFPDPEKDDNEARRREIEIATTATNLFNKRSAWDETYTPEQARIDAGRLHGEGGEADGRFSQEMMDQVISEGIEEVEAGGSVEEIAGRVGVEIEQNEDGSAVIKSFDPNNQKHRVIQGIIAGTRYRQPVQEGRGPPNYRDTPLGTL